MSHQEILVSYAPPLTIEFKRALRGTPVRYTSAKIVRAKPGDRLSWRLDMPGKPIPKLKAFTGFTIQFLTRGSPFDPVRKKYTFQGTHTPPMTVVPWASGRFFPYELTLDGVGLKVDPGVGVDPPGGYDQVDLAFCMKDNGELDLRSKLEAHPGDMLRFSCQATDGSPVDFEVTFGHMTLDDWPIYPPGDPSTPLQSIPGWGVTAYSEVRPVIRDFPFTLVTAKASFNGTLSVLAR